MLPAVFERGNRGNLRAQSNRGNLLLLPARGPARTGNDKIKMPVCRLVRKSVSQPLSEEPHIKKTQDPQSQEEKGRQEAEAAMAAPRHYNINRELIEPNQLKPREARFCFSRIHSLTTAIDLCLLPRKIERYNNILQHTTER